MVESRSIAVSATTGAGGSPTSSVRRRPVATPDRTRLDIQGLRAFAVTVVLLYHFWPRRLTGGYVGVDVFFVISGFLISSHLFRSPPTDLRGLAAFWARRVRRLLPAATVVLLCTLVAAVAWLPQTQLPQVARELAAAALYSENWVLAHSATDYLAAESAPSPVQHYWSLSVEEQYYLFWPILIFLLYRLSSVRATRRRGDKSPTPWLAAGLGAVFVSSLGASIHLTSTNPPAAYFVTHTRVWELALGALVALALHTGWRVPGAPLRAAAAWAGLGLMTWACLTFTQATAFPGAAALVPTVGTALVLAADGDGVAWSPSGLLGLRPSQRLGDVSYSVYLWHWPVVVIAPVALGRTLTWPVKLVLVALVLVVAALSKVYVEDTVRRAPTLVRSLPRSFAVAAVSISLVVASSVATVAWTDARQAADRAALHAALSDTTCLGAAALRNKGCAPIQGRKLLNSPSVARDDKPGVYADDCWSNNPFTRHRVCTYGDSGGKTRVALLGNSHAGHWQPALDPLARERHWRLDTYLVSQCYTVTIPIDLKPAALSGNCTRWNEWAIDSIIKGRYDLVVMSNRTWQPLRGVARADKPRVAEAAYRDVLKRFTDAGIRVMVIRDVPSAVTEAPDCVAQHLNDVTACDNPASKALESDPLAAASRADRTGMVTTLDLTDRFCRAGTCHQVIGGLLAYFDHGHLTATFTRTLEPDIGAALDRVMGPRQP
ncbi:acyltransferase family protein [Phycicoccus sp. M110.8]|uniref:acyltransferase family protein n=1 Tax=Phycicoccus sp. M110.8 TaxID=3075433 RepID=UPI003967CF16